jgi:hypothetical protein
MTGDVGNKTDITQLNQMHSQERDRIMSNVP